MTIKLPLLAAILSVIAVLGQAATIEGWVVGVTDGDTVTVLDGSNTQHKIRLAGIDAPDMQVPSKKS